MLLSEYSQSTEDLHELLQDLLNVPIKNKKGAKPFDALVGHPDILKHLTSLINIPVNLHVRCEDRIKLQKKSLNLLVNLSIADGVIEDLLLDHSLLKMTQNLILEHFTDKTNSLNKTHYTVSPILTKEELDLLADVLVFTATMATNKPAALGLSNDHLPEQIYLITKYYH